MRARGVGTLVVGLGNGHRGDDAAGLRVAELVRARAPNLRVLAIEGDPSVLIEAWAGVGLTIVIDAIEGAHPGRVHRIEPEHERVIGRLPSATSSHAIGLGEVIELARSIGRLPPRMVVFGIEGDSFDLGARISPPVAARLGELAESVLVEAETERPRTAVR